MRGWAAVSARARSVDRLPQRFTPQLATLVSTAPDGDAWLHELKYDGYRIGCRIDRGTVRLLSRNGNDWTARFPSLREAAMQLPVRTALLDGEVTVVLPDGRTSFQALQNALAAVPRSGKLVYFVFDLVHLDGTDIGRLPLEQRKARLQRVLGSTGEVIRYADHTVGDGPGIFSAACRRGAEGIVSKRRDLPYRPGRGGGWLKIKCIARQEFVIGGFTDPQGARVGLGALLVGVHDARGRLVFAGKVGTGFTAATARALRERLDAIEQAGCPFASRPAGRLGRGVHWVRPTLVAEVAFTEWTADGKIRHPSFQGVRADKRPSQVRRERPTAASRRRRAARGRSGTSRH
jgi:bifunctional non-homologous end joining protein LigD